MGFTYEEDLKWYEIDVKGAREHMNNSGAYLKKVHDENFEEGLKAVRIWMYRKIYLDSKYGDSWAFFEKEDAPIGRSYDRFLSNSLEDIKDIFEIMSQELFDKGYEVFLNIVRDSKEIKEVGLSVCWNGDLKYLGEFNQPISEEKYHIINTSPWKRLWHYGSTKEREEYLKLFPNPS